MLLHDNPRKPPSLTEPLFGGESAADAPLAARMRPRSLNEFVGQGALVGDTGALSRVVRPGYLLSMVLRDRYVDRASATVH